MVWASGGGGCRWIWCGSACAWHFNNQPNPQSSAPASINQVTQSPPPATRAVDGQLAVYWIESSKNKLIAVPIAIKAKSNDEAIASVINMLITEKPPESQLYSAIPVDTQVLSATTKTRKFGLIYLKLLLAAVARHPCRVGLFKFYTQQRL